MRTQLLFPNYQVVIECRSRYGLSNVGYIFEVRTRKKVDVGPIICHTLKFLIMLMNAGKILFVAYEHTQTIPINPSLAKKMRKSL